MSVFVVCLVAFHFFYDIRDVFEIRAVLGERLLVRPQLCFYGSPCVQHGTGVRKRSETRVFVCCGPITVSFKSREILDKGLLTAGAQYCLTFVGYVCVPFSGIVSNEIVPPD